MTYHRPKLERFGSFRELTKWGLASASDGGSILGNASPGCQTDLSRWGYGTISIDCPTGQASAS
ncbi:MAG: lasso RiPP family leader peptide-containing protein [Gemmatimonadales bacterium]|nr:lasso RiPP family leader peptide-containing protein [Gemmatimonadota bacterium]MCL4213195.1 lasso RiPP family leader peptide-containing protein [Gemmatimonadales bacterium]